MKEQTTGLEGVSLNDLLIRLTRLAVVHSKIIDCTPQTLGSDRIVTPSTALQIPPPEDTRTAPEMVEHLRFACGFLYLCAPLYDAIRRLTLWPRVNPIPNCTLSTPMF